MKHAVNNIINFNHAICNVRSSVYESIPNFYKNKKNLVPPMCSLIAPSWYDYKNKYQAGFAEEICPAPISAEDEERLGRLAERVSKALMVDVYCRADFIMDDDDGEIYCLEANTLPGMTPTSLVPQMAAEQGMSYGELCEKIIELSLEARKNKR